MENVPKKIRLNHEAVSKHSDLPAFISPPDGSPVYYGFEIVLESETDGWYYGAISDFLDPADYLKSREGKPALQELIQTIKSEPNLIAELDSESRQIFGEGILINEGGIFVSFPTKDIYFPTLPTSVYGSKIIPATIRVIGHVSPKIFQDIESYTTIGYYIDTDANLGEDLKNFYSGQNKNVKYTKIDISAPSQSLTDDLWISQHSPLKTYYSSFIARQPIICGVLLLILSSLMAGILAGWIVFKQLRRNIVKLGLIGLSNCLSIVCLIVVTHHNTPKGKRRFAFVALFSVSFLVISWLIVKLVESAV
jgi:hypothetical protein